jgi:hypothetical protein
MTVRSKVALATSIVVASAWLANDALAAEGKAEKSGDTASMNAERQDDARETWWSSAPRSTSARCRTAINRI